MLVHSDASLLIDCTIVTASYPRCDFTEYMPKVQGEVSMEILGVVYHTTRVQLQKTELNR